jgi:quercetin 2,3-dioxygenase
MKTLLHTAASRGHADHGWLKSDFSFSFADWHDPERMGFGALRVLNDDFIAPRSGFELHAHRDMEIITIVTAGTVTHEDSMGNAEHIKAGEVQVMTAGTGVTHSEYNHGAEPLILFQIWIVPRARGLRPRYAQWKFADPVASEPQLLVSPSGEGESLQINQDAFISRLVLTKGVTYEHQMRTINGGLYIFVVSGKAAVAGIALGHRDAAGVSETEHVSITATDDTHLLLIEVPMV